MEERTANKISAYSLLIVEDDDRIRRMLKDFFRLKKYHVKEAEDGEKAMELFYDEHMEIDLIILDILMPKMNGFEVLRELRKISDIPVIILTAKSSEIDQLEGFRKGADDYLTKPFSNYVLLAHVEAVLKRTADKTEEKKVRGSLVIEDDKKVALLNGKNLELTMKEYDLLVCLADHQGIVMSREMLLDRVWGYNYSGGTRTVDTHIKQLRAKLTRKYPYIKTVHGFGYQFEVDDVSDN